MNNNQKFVKIKEHLLDNFMKDEIISYLLTQNPAKYRQIFEDAAEKGAERIMIQTEMNVSRGSNIIPFPIMGQA